MRINSRLIAIAAWTAFNLTIVANVRGIDLQIPLPWLLNGGPFAKNNDAEPEPLYDPAPVPKKNAAQTPPTAQYASDQYAQSQTAQARYAQSQYTPQRYAPESSNVEVDLSPQFSNMLPYSVAIGKVVCESDFPLDSMPLVESEIIQLQRDLIGFLGVPESREKIELCLFGTFESYRRFIDSVFPGAPNDRPALYVKEPDQPGVLMVPRDQQMIVNIRHEMTHAYLNASLKNVPIWIDEGLAKYFEIPPGERGFRNPYLEKAEEKVAGFFASPPSLARLEKLAQVDQMKTREYRESWSWVHYMLHYSPQTQRVLSYYLRSLRPEAQRGISMQEAQKLQKNAPMKKALEKFEPNYKREYVEHFRKWDELRSEYELGKSSDVARRAGSANFVGR